MNLDNIKIYLIAQQFEFMQVLDSAVLADTGNNLSVNRYVAIFLSIIKNRQTIVGKATFIAAEQPTIEIRSFKQSPGIVGWSAREDTMEICNFVSIFNNREDVIYRAEIIDNRINVKLI